MVSKKLMGYLSLSLAASFWGTMLVIGKPVMTQISPFFVLWVRYLIAFFLLFIVLSIKKEKINKSDLPFMAWLGFVGYFLSNGASFLGTHLSTAQLGSLFIGTSPVFTMFLAIFILKERMTWRKVLSILLASTGIFIVVGIQTEYYDNHFIVGAIILLLGAITWALYSIYVRRINYSPLLISTYATGFGVVFTTPAMMWQFQTQDLYLFLDVNHLLSAVYLGIVATALAFLLWNKGIQYVEAGIGSIFIFFQVIAGGLLAWIFLGEELTKQFFIGSILILIAILIMMHQDKQPSNNKRRKRRRYKEIA